MPTKDDLLFMQRLPLDMKIALTKSRIREWIRYFGNSGVYVSFSGGKDSTVLLDIVRQDYPDVKAVFVDTGLEYPEIRSFVKTFDNVEILRPKMRFDEVIKKYGYPVFGKEIARSICEYQKWVRKGSPENNVTADVQKILGIGQFSEGSMYNKSKYKNIADNSKFYISSNCCDVMKKSPVHKYGKVNSAAPITATTAEESRMRADKWLKQGCNAFDNKNPVSNPMSFWTEQDILTYIDTVLSPKIRALWGTVNNSDIHGSQRKSAIKSIKKIGYKTNAICSVYGDICEVDTDGNLFFGLGEAKLKCSGCQRTGCMFCGFGAHLEKGDDRRFLRLKHTHPKQYDYCINGGEYDISDGMWKPNHKGLGMGKVLDFIGVDF